MLLRTPQQCGVRQQHIFQITTRGSYYGRLTMRFSSLLFFTSAILILSWVAQARAVYDVSPRLVTLPSGQERLATYGYDDAGDNSTNPIYLTTNPNRVFAYFFGDYADPYFDEDPGTHGLATTSGYTPSNL